MSCADAAGVFQVIGLTWVVLAILDVVKAVDRLTKAVQERKP